MAALRLPALFDEAPRARRRLVLLLYVLVGPIFSAILFLEAEEPWRRPATLAVAGLIVAGAALLFARPEPGPLDWIFPVAFAPTACCGIAFVASGSVAPAYLGVLGAPLAWSAVLFETPVVWAALAAALATCFAAVGVRLGLVDAVANTVVFGTVFGLVAWVVHSQAQALRAARAEARALLEAIPDTVVRADGEGHFLALHAPPGEDLPLPAEQLIGRSVLDFLPGEAALRLRQAIERALGSAEVQHLEYRAAYPGGPRLFETRIARAGDGEVLVIRRDVTQRHEAEKDQQFLATLVANMDESVIVVDLDLEVLAWSPGAERLFGLTASQALGQPVFGLTRPDLTATGIRAWRERLLAQGRVRETAPRTRRDGTHLIAESTYVLLKDEAGLPVGILGVARDVTEGQALHQEELDHARLHGLEERSNETELVVRLDGIIVAANDRALETYGYSRGELVGLDVRELRTEPTGLAVPDQTAAAWRAGARFETSHRRKDGTTFPAEVSSRGFSVRGERYLHALVRDLTEARVVDGERRLLAGLVRNMSDAVVVTDARRRITEYTGHAEAIYGWARPEVLGKDLLQDFVVEFPGGDGDEVRHRLDAGEEVRTSLRARRKDGAWIDLDLVAVPLRDEAGELTGWLSVARDIGAQVAATRALRESEERYRLVVATSGEGIVMRRADGVVSAFNPAAERLLGIDAAQMQGWKPLDPGWRLLREDGTPLPIEERPNQAALRTGLATSRFVMGVQKPDGSVTWLSVNSQPVFHQGQEKPYAVVAIYRDVTQERSAAAALAHSGERLRLALAAAATVEWDWDVGRDRFALGPGWRDLVGSEPRATATAADWKALIHPDDLVATWSAALACLEGRAATIDARYRLRVASGWRWVRSRGQVTVRDAAGRPLRAMGTLTDVTEVQELQEKLLSATRLASVGTLAAGVAHEVNNPLAWVTANLSHALELVGEGPNGPRPEAVAELRDVLGEARLGTARIADIVMAMRSLGRPGQAAAAQQVDVRRELLDALQLVRNQVVQRAALTVRIPEQLPAVRASSELGRAFLSLLVNAAQAIPEGRADAHEVVVEARAADGEVVVQVADSGAGMAAAVRERIFDPFFTTRPVGQGTGLGLTIARAIVDAAGGRIEVESEPGRGAIFRVHLPVEAEAAPRATRPEGPAAAPPRRRVLVIDDEPLIRRALERLLRRRHEVEVLGSAAEALRRIQEGQRWDAILCDFMMPGLDGIAFHQALADRHAELLPRLGFITGGAFGDRAATFLAEHEVEIVHKPVELDQLLAAVERLAGAGVASA